MSEIHNQREVEHLQSELSRLMDENAKLRQLLESNQRARVLQGKAVIDADDQLCVSRETTLQLLGQVGQLSEEVSRLKDVEARLRAALERLYWYATRLEIVVYDDEDDGECEVMKEAHAALEAKND